MFIIVLYLFNDEKEWWISMKKMYSMEIASAINEFLVNDNWKFSFEEEYGIFRFGLSLKGRMKKVDYVIDVKNNNYLVYAISPIGVDSEDSDMMAKMAEFICRVNYGVTNGNFEFDMNSGQIQYKSYIDCADIIPSDTMIRNSINCPAIMFDQYGIGILAIIFGDVTVKEALDKCEKSKEEVFRTLFGEDVDTMLAQLMASLDSADSGKEEPVDMEDNEEM